jgi:uncharacterized repeat protein (TIGR01451 family)/CSLREA domain-containing protein
MTREDLPRSGRVARVAGLALLATLFSCGSAQAVNYQVDLNDDPTPNGCTVGHCSLREAIIAANSNTSADAIFMNNRTVTLTIPGDGEDAAATGDLDANGNGSQGDLQIVSGTIVSGSGHADRVLHVGSTQKLTLSAVNLRDGNVVDDATNPSGGNLLSQGELVMSNGEVTGGRAGFGGGIDANGDSAELSGVTLSGNESRSGGGVANGTEMTITNSRFVDNDAMDGRGGGLNHTALESLTVSGSHFEGNSAFHGGAIAFQGGSQSAQIVFDSSLIGNTAVSSGGGIFAQSQANLWNVTVAENTVTSPIGEGGGVDIQTANKTVELKHLTIARNSAAAGPQVSIGAGTLSAVNVLVAGACRIGDLGIVTGVGNVSTGSSCGFTGPDNLSGASVRLGPVTEAAQTSVLPLLGGSDAIDAAAPLACLGTDQRGVVRSEPECDAGAYEALKTDLSLGLTAEPAALLVGEDVTITLTATNKGPRATAGVFATVPLPAGTSFVSGSPGCSAGPPVVCTLGSLDPDAAAQATVVARTSAPGELSFTASGLGDLAELTPGDESPTATVQVSEPLVTPPPVDPDIREPVLGIALARGQRARRAARLRRLRVRLTSDEACTGDVEVRKGGRRLARVRGGAFAAATTTVRLAVGKRAARRLRRARRLSLRATCADAAGNAATITRTVKIKR